MPDKNRFATPTVSVCIPSYRGAAHLRATIDSVLAQSLADFELLIIDDNSRDGTAEIVESYADERIRFLQNTRNLGPEGNWNRCLGEARGKYFKLLPQDDLLERTCIQKQAAVLESDVEQAISLVFCARNIINPSGKRVMSRGYPGSSGKIVGVDAIRRSLRGGTNLIGEPGGVMFRKSLADMIGPFDGSIGYVIDVDYWVRLLIRGDGWYLDEKLVSYRISGGAWSVAIGKGQSLAYSDFVDRVAACPGCGLSGYDRLSGKLMARVNNVLRLLVYRVLL